MSDETLPIARPAAPSGWRNGMALLVMLAGAALMGMIFQAVTPILPAIAAHLGGRAHNILLAQMVMTISSLGLMFGGPPAGWLIERLGIRPVLFTGVALYGFLGSAGLYLEDPYLLLATRLLLGLAAVAFGTCTISLISDRYEGAARAKVLGYRVAFGSAAGVISTLVAGQLADAYGWRAPFALYLTGFVVLALAVVSIPATPGRRRAVMAPPVGDRSLIALWPVFLLVVAMNVAAFMANTQVPFLLTDDGVKSAAVLSRVATMPSGAYMIGAGGYGQIRLRLNARGAFLLAVAFMAAGILTIGLSHGPVLAGLGCALLGTGGGILNPHFAAIIIDRAPPEIRGRAIGLMYMALFAGDFLNPFLIAPLRGSIGIHNAFVLVGVMLVIFGVVVSTRRRPAAA